MTRRSILGCILHAVTAPALLLAAGAATGHSAPTSPTGILDTSKTYIIFPQTPASLPENNRPSNQRDDISGTDDGDNGLKVILPIIRELLPHVVRPDAKDSVQNRIRVEVPDVRTMPIDQARQTLEGKGLMAEPVIEGAPGEPEDIVVSQSPLPRTYLLQGSAVRLEVTSPVILKVPRVIGMALPDARNIIESTGLATLPVGDDEASAGAVVQDQDPQPDTGVRKGTLIRLTLRVRASASETPSQQPPAPPQQEPPEITPPAMVETPSAVRKNPAPSRLIFPHSDRQPQVISTTAILVAAVAIFAMLGSIVLIRRSLQWHQTGAGGETIGIFEHLDPGEQNLQISEPPQSHREVSVAVHQDKGTQEMRPD